MDAQEAAEQAKAHYGNDVELTQEEDVLDTWFHRGCSRSQQWDGQRTRHPQEVLSDTGLETGSDILFFWLRACDDGNLCHGQGTFSHVFACMVRDEKGQKMSKVKGNVIDPLHMINEVLRDELHQPCTKNC